ncbi:MAG TPA: TIGR00730 family Rossman fold protein [Fibrobacter sp.]|nr:TIGR00730 family Rossman fold protein [Fibrobacter sp.]
MKTTKSTKSKAAKTTQTKKKTVAPRQEPLISYYDVNFLESEAGRQVRMLSEFTAPGVTFKQERIKNTIVFFGSARTLPMSEIKSRQKKTKDPKTLERLKNLEKVAESYDLARELSKKLSKWINHPHHEGYAICTGGGPGIMEAGNRGADDVGAPSVGLNIKLPFEQHSNPYITDCLNLQFRYFFIRKYWFLNLSRALVVFPGGYGTLDELFEMLTLIQTNKYAQKMPVVVFGTKFWKKLINWSYLAETGMIDKEDLSLFKFTDSIDEAYDFITNILEQQDSAI